MKRNPSRTPNPESRTPFWHFILFAGVTLSCCSCTTARSMARTEDFSDEIQKSKLRATQVSAEEKASAHNSVPPESASSGVFRVRREKSASAIQLVGHEEAVCPPNAIIVCPPEPREPAAGPNPFAIGMPACEVCRLPDPETYADEYLCDGGDRELPVHYDSQQRFGLDTEDTVAEYTDHTGRERMKPSNKVCVYAPRFAAVRSVSGPVLSDSLRKSVGVENTAGEDVLRSKVASSLKTKRDPAGGIRVRSRAGGLETDAVSIGVQQDFAALHHDKINNLFQGINLTLIADADQTTAARLNYGLQAAVAWSREASPTIAGQVEQPFEGLIEVSAATLTVIDDKKVPGELEIMKFADKKEAHPGDEITFTIRYRNTGDLEIYYVKIVDNLTPRLDYIDDSTTSDRQISLDTEDNGEGSLLLTFELEQPLPPRGTGVITFKTRVR